MTVCRRLRWAAAAVLVAAALLLTGPASASAIGAAPGQDDTSVTAAQLRVLAGRAVEDPAALAQLRRVRTVDGRQVDIDAGLAGADGPELAARLRQLAGDGAPGATGSGAPTAGDPGVARAAARDVLDRDKYQPTGVPRPFRGALAWLGDRLEPVLGPVGRMFQRIADNPLGAVALTAVALVAATVLGRMMVGRRGRAAVAARDRAVGGSRLDDPATLEAKAVAAEADGQLDRALRLRFRAGLLRLDRSGVLRYRSSLTAGEVRRELRSTTFDGLALTFDEVVYGGRPAGASDVEAAKRAWPVLLAEADRR